MKIQNFNQHKSRKLTRLTKEELDTMSKREIEDYQTNFTEKYLKYDRKLKTWTKDENFQYLVELDVYKEVRFKQDKFDQDEWIRKADNNEGSTETDKRTYKLLASILVKENGKEIMYNGTLSSDVKKVGGEFKFILGIELDEEALKPFM